MNNSANFALRSRRVITNSGERAATVVVAAAAAEQRYYTGTLR